MRADFLSRKKDYERLYAFHYRALRDAFADAPHSAFGFPLIQKPGVYFSHSHLNCSPAVIAAYMGDLSGKTVLDVGCGCGVIAIAAALCGAVSVVACDIDPESIDLTRQNARLNNVEDRLEALESDVLDNILTTMPGRTFDLIVANLYFPTRYAEEYGAYEEEYRQATDSYDRFFADINNVLAADGTAYLTSSEFADKEVIDSLMAKNHIEPVLTTERAPLFDGAFTLEEHLYSFGKNGRPKPPLHIPL